VREEHFLYMAGFRLKLLFAHEICVAQSSSWEKIRAMKRNLLA